MSFVPSEMSYGSPTDIAKHRVDALLRTRSRYPRGSGAWGRLTKQIRDLRATMDAAHGIVPTSHVRPAAPAADAADADDAGHDLAVDLTVDTDVPLFKRPIFWAGVGVVGLAVWKRQTIIAIVKGA